jgi:nucleoside-diphosphate-sugar epimerase
LKILVTGGFGNVGRSVVEACIASGHEVTIFDTPFALDHARNGLLALLKKRWSSCRIILGDIRTASHINRALSSIEGGPDAIVHLAALIPPESDRNETKAWDINVNGTKALLEAASLAQKKPRFVLASSIAVYGDRLKDFWIGTDDQAKPSDIYSKTKIECESMVKASGLEYVILRLSYVVWSKWFPFDPLLFSMPPQTKIEIIHTDDAGRAFASAAVNPLAASRTFNIGGGQACRTIFRVYLDRIFLHFGLGVSSFLPDSAFAPDDFHCGWYADSDEANRLLEFRSKSLEDFYEEVRWEKRFLRPLVRGIAPFVRRWLRAKSPFIKENPRHRASCTQVLSLPSKQEKL